MRKLPFILLATLAFAQDFTIVPSAIHQGETLKLKAGANVASARMNGISAPLFPQSDGTRFGLLPVSVEDKPGPYKLDLLDQAGAVIEHTTIAVRDAHYPKQNVVLTKELTALKSTPEEQKIVHAFLQQVSPVRFWEEPFQLPIPGCLTSPFGAQRLHNGKATGDYHGGVDQRGAAGTPIHAVAAGTVRIAQMFTLRGGTIAIDHGQGLASVYMHMSKLGAKEGQQVEAGEVVGFVGSTGRSTAPHLHWSLYVDGHPVQPLQWVRAKSCYAAPASARKKTAAKKKAR